MGLERSIQDAHTNADRAQAYYNLGVFHDNNSRELAAIPNYEAALSLGLDAETRAKCLAWLASSLYKTGRPTEAMTRALEAGRVSSDADLSRFIAGLKRRISRASAAQFR
jgi:hypothetical protein